MSLRDFFASKPLIGMVHLPALPGAPQNRLSIEAICAHALDEARLLEFYGMDALLVENYGDVPFYLDQAPPSTLAMMTRVAGAIREAVSIPLGVNVLRNDACAAMSIAAAVGAAFIRVNVHVGAMLTDQGILQGRAYDTLRLREVLQSDVWIFADVFVKHAVPLAYQPLLDQARDTLERGLADALILTGNATGVSISLDDLRSMRDGLPEANLLAGSGVTPETLPDILEIADGAIIGTALKRNGRTTHPIDPARVNRMISSKGLMYRQ